MYARALALAALTFAGCASIQYIPGTTVEENKVNHELIDTCDLGSLQSGPYAWIWSRPHSASLSSHVINTVRPARSTSSACRYAWSSEKMKIFCSISIT